MKKTLFLLLAVLMLCGCGATPEPSPAPLPELFEAAETAAPNEETPPAPAEPAETETPAPSAPSAGETVTLDGVNGYLRLTLPEGWTCEQGEDSASEKCLLLRAPTDDGFAVEVKFWSVFGMCGTGVTFEELTLPNGMTATLATEPSADSFVLWTLILPASPEQYTLHIYAPRSAIDAHQAELDAMLATLRIGERAEIPVQPKDVEA